MLKILSIKLLHEILRYVSSKFPGQCKFKPLRNNWPVKYGCEGDTNILSALCFKCSPKHRLNNIFKNK